jgi:hypothetical protein
MKNSKKKKEAHLSEEVTFPENESALLKIDSPGSTTISDDFFTADMETTTEKGPINTSPSSSNCFAKEDEPSKDVASLQKKNLSPKILLELGANKADDDKTLKKKLFLLTVFLLMTSMMIKKKLKRR